MSIHGVLGKTSVIKYLLIFFVTAGDIEGHILVFTDGKNPVALKGSKFSPVFSLTAVLLPI